MAHKKITLLAILFCIVATASFAQPTQGSYDYRDTTVIPKKRMSQHNSFLNHEYPFPAKPRNMWEIGISGGALSINSDVKNSFRPLSGFGISVRKALGYVFSLRAEYIHGTGKGYNWEPTGNYDKNAVWSTRYNTPVRSASGQLVGSLTGLPFTSGDVIYSNYKTIINEATIQGVFTLNNIRFHKGKSGLLFYGFAGFGGATYNVKIDALNSNGQAYRNEFNNLQNRFPITYSNRKSIIKELKNILDGNYESSADVPYERRAKLFGNPFTSIVTAGAGVQIKLSERFNFGLEHKITRINTDYLDGQAFQNGPVGDVVLSSDKDSYQYTSLRLNYSIGGKSVAPLWWMNPLDYAYNELNKPTHILFPKPILPDGDGDGVADQFDNEPNTPQGSPVDAHGVSLDTDGDGVPDIRDKEKITPTYCQPVDADGVGKCPDPACCDSISAKIGNLVVKDNSCKIGYIPSINFKKGQSDLNADQKAVLAGIAGMLKVSENCKIKISGHPMPSKSSQKLNQKRIDAIVKFLMESQGLQANRIEFNYDGGNNTKDNENIVEIVGETLK